MYPPVPYNPAMIKKSSHPGGQEGMNNRPKPEKEEVMKATKTIGTLIAVCFGFFCLSSYAAAGENALASNMDINADYVSDIQGTTTDLQEGQSQSAVGSSKVTAVTAIVAYVAAPWGVASTTLTVFSGIGLIADALTTEKNEAPDMEKAQNIEIAKADQ